MAAPFMNQTGLMNRSDRTEKMDRRPFMNQMRRSNSSSSRRDEGRRSYSRSSYTTSSMSMGRSSGGAERSNQSAPNHPTYVTCHGLEVSNVDNYIANLFR